MVTVLGVSLRPWSGHSPISLIVRGVLEFAICIILLITGLNMRATMREMSAVDDGARQVGGFLALAGFALVVLALVAALRITVGVFDLVPRKSVPGTVVQVSERRFLDFLPDYVNNALWDRNGQAGRSCSERRKVRHELWIDTRDGIRAWTMRDIRKAHGIRIGQRVTVVASPLLGYVDRLESHPWAAFSHWPRSAPRRRVSRGRLFCEQWVK